MRIVVDVKRDANANVILNKLFKMTALQSSFSVNCIALVAGRPRLLSLRECIKYFVEHRHDVTIRRAQFDLKKAQERAHILEALIKACDNIDEVVRIIRASKTPSEAQRNLEKRFDFDELQSRAIVDMRLSQLTGLRLDQLHQEFEELMQTIKDLEEILNNPERCKEVMRKSCRRLRRSMAMTVVQRLSLMSMSLMLRTSILMTLLLLLLVILVILSALRLQTSRSRLVVE